MLTNLMTPGVSKSLTRSGAGGGVAILEPRRCGSNGRKCARFSPAALRKSVELNESYCCAGLRRDWSIPAPDERSPEGRTEDFRKSRERFGRLLLGCQTFKKGRAV